MLRKPAAFDPREVLAQRIDLDDRGTRGEQRPRHRLLVRERKAGGRRDPVSRSAAGNKHQHQVVGPGGIGQVERFGGCGKPGRIGHRVARLDDAHAARRPAVAATGDCEPVDPARRHALLVEIIVLRDLGHGPSRLAGGQDHQPAGGRGRRQVRPQAAGGMRGFHRRAEQAFEKGAGRRGQGIDPDAGRTMRPAGQVPDCPLCS